MLNKKLKNRPMEKLEIPVRRKQDRKRNNSADNKLM
jgi:hypothetical protein